MGSMFGKGPAFNRGGYGEMEGLDVSNLGLRF